MSDAYVIELQGSAVGIIVRRNQDEPAYRFMAALHGFNSLEGVEFSGPFQAEIAARNSSVRTWSGGGKKQPSAWA